MVVGVADIMCRKHGNRKVGAVVESSSEVVSIEDEDITLSMQSLNNRSYPTLPYPTLPYPTLVYSTLPYPNLPVK